MVSSPWPLAFEHISRGPHVYHGHGRDHQSMSDTFGFGCINGSVRLLFSYPSTCFIATPFFAFLYLNAPSILKLFFLACASSKVIKEVKLCCKDLQLIQYRNDWLVVAPSASLKLISGLLNYLKCAGLVIFLREVFLTFLGYLGLLSRAMVVPTNDGSNWVRVFPDNAYFHCMGCFTQGSRGAPSLHGEDGNAGPEKEARKLTHSFMT